MKRIASILVLITIVVSCIRFSPCNLKTVAANDNNSPWLVSSQNDENILFYPDSNTKAPKSYEENGFSYSLAIRNLSGSRTAYYEKTFYVQKNTDYVINAFVKSTFTKTASKTGFNTKQVMPTKIVVIDGSKTIESYTSIGQDDEWQETSVGFKTNTNTSIKIRLYVDFNQVGTVWFDNIRLDKPETTKVLMLAYDKIDAVYDNVSYYSKRKSEVTNDVVIETMRMFDDEMKELSNSKIITDTTVIFPGTLSNLHFADDRMYANYSDIKDVVESQSQNYDFVFVLMPANAGKYINGKTPYMGVCYSAEGVANVDQGLVTGSLPTEYNAPLDGICHEFIHYIEYLSKSKLNSEAPFLDHYETGFDYDSDGDKSIKINEISYNSYYDYYMSNINKSNSRNYVEKVNVQSPPIYQHLNVKYQWYYDVLNGQVQHYNSGFWGHRSISILKDGTVSEYHMNTEMIPSGVYNLKNNYYTSNPYLKEDNTILSHVSEKSKINEYWNISCVDGYYELTPLNNPSLRLTVDTLSLSSQPDKGTIKLTAANNSNSQKWLIEKIGTNQYKIVSKLDSTRCFEYAYGGVVNEAQMWVYVGGNNQKWSFENVETFANGTYNIRNNYYNKYINFNNDSSLSLSSNNNMLADNWVFEKVGDYFKIRPALSYNTPLSVKEISLPENSAQGQINFKEDACDYSQLWIVVKLNDGSYRITSAIDPNKCFEYSYGNIYNEAQMWNFVDGANQKWALIRDNIAISKTMKNPYYNNYLSGNLSMSGSSYNWTIKPYENYYIIYNSNGRLTLSDVSNGSKVYLSNNAEITDDQKWTMNILDNGNYVIAPMLNNQKCLEYSYGNITNQLQVWEYVNGNNQQWILN